MSAARDGGSIASDRLAISDAIADVALAARRVAIDRVELVRLEARNDLEYLLRRVVAYGAVAVVALGIGLWIVAFALLDALAALVPTSAAVALVAVPLLVTGVTAGVRARRHLLERGGEPTNETSAAVDDGSTSDDPDALAPPPSKSVTQCPTP